MANDGVKPSAGNRKGDDLPHQSQAWRTPSSRDWKGESAKSWQGREHADPTPTLVDQVALSPLAQQITPDGEGSSSSGRVLNPRFVEALMGWPIDLTDYTSWEMELTHYKPLWRSLLWQLKCERLGGSELVETALEPAWATPAAVPAGGTAEAFLERKRRANSNGHAMGVALTDLSLQASIWEHRN